MTFCKVVVPLAFQPLSNGAVSFDTRLVLPTVEQQSLLGWEWGGEFSPSVNRTVKVEKQRDVSGYAGSHPHVALS